MNGGGLGRLSKIGRIVVGVILLCSSAAVMNKRKGNERGELFVFKLL